MFSLPSNALTHCRVSFTSSFFGRFRRSPPKAWLLPPRWPRYQKTPLLTEVRTKTCRTSEEEKAAAAAKWSEAARHTQERYIGRPWKNASRTRTVAHAREDADTILSSDSIFLLDLAEREQLRMERETYLYLCKGFQPDSTGTSKLETGFLQLAEIFGTRVGNHQHGCGFRTLVELYRSASHFNLLPAVWKTHLWTQVQGKIGRFQFCILTFSCPKGMLQEATAPSQAIFLSFSHSRCVRRNALPLN